MRAAKGRSFRALASSAAGSRRAPRPGRADQRPENREIQRENASDPVLVRDNLKIGNFSLSFVDLEVPLVGFPIRVTRTYDSRDKRPGDFGVGWRLDVSNVRVQTNGPLGEGWVQTRAANIFADYCLEADRNHIVTLTFPDGRVEQFQAVPEPACQSSFDGAIQQGAMQFTAVGPTLGTLSTRSGDYFLAPSLGPVTLFDASSTGDLEIQSYEYTAPD